MCVLCTNNYCNLPFIYEISIKYHLDVKSINFSLKITSFIDSGEIWIAHNRYPSYITLEAVILDFLVSNFLKNFITPFYWLDLFFLLNILLLMLKILVVAKEDEIILHNFTGIYNFWLITCHWLIKLRTVALQIERKDKTFDFSIGYYWTTEFDYIRGLICEIVYLEERFNNK